MVIFVVKKFDDPQFLYETTISKGVDDTVKECVEIYNGRLKVSRICYEMEELAKHGTMFPPEILGLTDEQVAELKVQDPWSTRCAPIGWEQAPDLVGRRCGKRPPNNMREVINKAVAMARDTVSKKLCESGKCVTQSDIVRALAELSGAASIVYPMGLPPHDPIRQELENREDLEGTQASLEVMDPATTVMWFCGKQLIPGSILSKQLGTNDKCKIVVKLCKRGDGPPGREPVMSEEDRKQLMLHAYRRQEELKVSD